MLRRKFWIPIAVLFLLLVLGTGGWLAWNAYSLNVIPLKYLLIGCGGILVIALIVALFLFAGIGKGPRISRRVLRIIGIILSLLFSAVFFFAAKYGTEIYNSAVAVIDRAGLLKDELSSAVENIQNEKFEDAGEQIELMESDAAAIRETLSQQEWVILSKIPVIGQNIEAADKMLDVLQEASDDVLKPAIKYLSESPLSQFEGDLTFETMGPEMSDQLDFYADMLDELIPNAEQLITDFGTIPTFTIPQLEDQISGYRDMVDGLGTVIPQFDGISDDLIRPLADTMRETPLSSLKVGKGINVNVLNTYLDLIANVQPNLEGFSETLDSYKDNENFLGLSEKLTSALGLIDSLGEYLPMIRTLVGDGSDRIYLMVAQNSAEMRAAGGFPGSVGVLLIQDGLMTAGNFASVIDYLPEYASYPFYTADNENALFTWWEPSKVRDAGWNPHFPKVGEIWAAGFRDMHGINVNGVISVTPHIIQDLLAVSGPVTLSNGAVLDGQNATRYLQHDLYYSYYTADNFISEDYINGLFSETAEAAMLGLIVNLELEKLPDVLRVFKEAAEDRTLMIWMADGNEQQNIVAAGYSGSLNVDPQDPEIGVYYSVFDGDKVGWYIGIDTLIGD
ncbi:MAG: DUF4012 domain-containing protein, partial [Lachnospiraceae bacterium]|nr:DUF4012 domain-containing protein [Lachnospiraceae bacterium]